jgi:5-deoxy-5-amino-3-dehydroquinate synthase
MDKKATTGLSFVLDGPGGAELVENVPEAAVSACLADMPRHPYPALTRRH